MTSSTTEQKTTQPAKTPLLTWKSFLVSFGIILVVYLVVSALVGDNSPDEPEEATTFTSGGDTFEYTVVDGDEDSENSILAVQIKGIILTEPLADEFSGLFGDAGATYGYVVKEQLERAAETPEIEAVVLEINSPGGTIGGAQAISEGVAFYQEQTGNPVYAHITDTGASGGYWAAAATEYIGAQQGALVGSIGVIMGPFRYYDEVTAEGSLFGGVNTEGGIEYRFFTGGEYKDTGSPYRQLTDEEIEHWQTSIEQEYNVFVNHVSENRGLTDSFIREQVRALPYNVQQARELNLIDEVISRDALTDQLASAAGLDQDDYNVVVEEDVLDSFLTEIFGAELVTRFGLTTKAGAGASAVSAGGTGTAQGCQWCFTPLYLYDSSYQLTSPSLQ
jgi:protease-4